MATCPVCKCTLPDDFMCCPYDGASLGGSPAPHPGPSIALSQAEHAMIAGLSDRFEIRARLGQGGMATVFHGVERKAGMDVAIKVMSNATARSPPERQRFLREAEMMLPVRHPNIMHVYALGELKDGSPYIVMQYLDGESLGALFRRGDPVDLALALRIASEAAAGLATAHAEGIVHRDVKPDNIFLVGSPERLRGVKVLDFGLARLAGSSGLTAKGMIVGTPEYMAPEQAVNDGTDARSDVYALGVVLYRLLTGVLPFAFQNEIDLLAAHLALRPPPLLRFGVRTHEAVERVLMGALRKVPGNRYASMNDFYDDLERLRAERYDDVFGPASLCEDEYVAKAAFAQNIARILSKKAIALTKG
jgi:eukaryotic-like serine/threonine-protein kinase